MRRATQAATAALTMALCAGALAQRVQTVFYIPIENINWTQPPGQSRPQLQGNPAAPWLNSLIEGRLKDRVNGKSIGSQTAYAVAYHQVLATASGDNPHIHPSEPNYIWMEAGTNHGVQNDNPPYGPDGNNQATDRHLASELLRAGQSFRSYQEDIDLAGAADGKTNTVLPRDRWTVPLSGIFGRSGAYTNEYNGSHQYHYAPKHNPMVFFSDTNGGNDATPANPAARHYAPLQQLWVDLDRHQVAAYNWITPDQFNDMHSELEGGFNYRGVHYDGWLARVAQGDNFLSQIVPRIMASQAYQQGGAIVIWCDETEGLNPDAFVTTLPEIVISPLAHPNVGGKPYASEVPMTHSDDLRSLQNILGVNPGTGYAYLGDAAHAHGLDDLFAPGAVEPGSGPTPGRP